MFNSSFEFLVARPEYGDAYYFKICRMHGQLSNVAMAGFWGLSLPQIKLQTPQIELWSTIYRWA